MEIFIEFAKSWGAPGLMALILWWQLDKSEKREGTKDIRIQLLENKLMESYDERIDSAEQVTTALMSNAASSRDQTEVMKKAIDALHKRR